MAGNTDGSTTVGDTIVEGANVAGLVSAGETLVVVLTIDSNVLHVAEAHLLDGLLDSGNTALLTHLEGGEVGVAASAVPVTLDRLGVDRDSDAKVLSNALEKVAGSPEVVTALDTLARTDLELELARGNLSVHTRDVDTGVQASAVVGLNDVTTKDLASTDTTVVLALMKHQTV